MARFSMLSALSLLCLSFTASANVIPRNIVTTATATTTGGVVLPTAHLGSCPAADGARYDTPNGVYQVQCGVDYSRYNIPGPNGGIFPNFQACLDKCASDSRCVTVSYLTATQRCWRHTIVTGKSPNPAVWAALKISGPVVVMPSIPFSDETSTAVTSTTTTSATSTSTSHVTTATSSSTSSSTKAATTSSSSSSTSTKAATSTSTTATPSGTPAALSCPAYNGKPFIDSTGADYNISCDMDLCGDDLTSSLATTFADCLTDCSGMANCVGVSWVPLPSSAGWSANCFMKDGRGTVPPLTSDNVLSYVVHSALKANPV